MMFVDVKQMPSTATSAGHNGPARRLHPFASDSHAAPRVTGCKATPLQHEGDAARMCLQPATSLALADVPPIEHEDSTRPRGPLLSSRASSSTVTVCPASDREHPLAQTTHHLASCTLTSPVLGQGSSAVNRVPSIRASSSWRRPPDCPHSPALAQQTTVHLAACTLSSSVSDRCGAGAASVFCTFLVVFSWSFCLRFWPLPGPPAPLPLPPGVMRTAGRQHIPLTHLAEPSGILHSARQEQTPVQHPPQALGMAETSAVASWRGTLPGLEPT